MRLIDIEAVLKAAELAEEMVVHLMDENKTLRNEICLKCERYKTAHLGSCNGCRWGEKGEGE